MFKQEFDVSGMTCGSCEASVRDELEEISGISEIQVSAAENSLVVTGDDSVSTDQVIAAVAEAGYQAVVKA